MFVFAFVSLTAYFLCPTVRNIQFHSVCNVGCDLSHGEVYTNESRENGPIICSS